MALPQRSASRFFAAFGRWARHNQQQLRCAHPAALSRGSLCRPSAILARTYHASRRPSQQQTTDNAGAESQLPAEADDAEVAAIKLKNEVRLLMRNVPSAVAILTVAHYDASLQAHVPLGIAISSLSTVSLDPPTISFNIKCPSQSLDAIRAAGGRFRVHFPGSTRSSAALAELFTHGNHQAAYIARTKSLKIARLRPERQDGKNHSSAPQILEDFVRAAMECTLTHELPVADHVILVAKVDTIESKMKKDATDRSLLYVNGKYWDAFGNPLPKRHSAFPFVSDDSWSVWDYPLSPGIKERQDYVDRIKAEVKKNPELLTSAQNPLTAVEAILPLKPIVLGINLEVVIDECRRAAGGKSLLPEQMRNTPALYDFWGRLTPSDRAKMIERVKNFARADPRLLEVNYVVALNLLGVSPWSVDLLPSDIMEPLRQDGLVGPFEPKPKPSSSAERPRLTFDLKYMEQLEHQLRDEFAARSYEELRKASIGKILDKWGEPWGLSTSFTNSRARFYTTVEADLFSPPNVDIFGEVTEPEARVVLNRIYHNARVENIRFIRRAVRSDVREALRRIHVHPSITGLNIEFLFEKLRNLVFTTQRSEDIAPLFKKSLKPWLQDTITLAELETRVKDFVNKMPRRAMSWGKMDKMAAMGLEWEARVEMPTQPEPQLLRRGHTINTLIARELRELHSQSDSGLSKDIAKYLQDQYDFAVTAQPEPDELPGRG